MKCCVNDCSIYYELVGTGKPILCIHGFEVDHRLMKGCLEPIFDTIDGFCRVYFDLPGMGRSGAQKEIKNSDDMLETIVGFIEKVIGNEHFMVVAQSYGSYLTLGLLRHLEHLIDGVLLISPCVIANSKDRDVPAKTIIVEDQRLTMELKDTKTFLDYTGYAVVVTPETWKRYNEEIFPGVCLSNKVFTQNFFNSGYAYLDESKIHNIKFDKPSCIITGRQDSCVGYRDTEKMLDNFPRASFYVLDAAGHNLQIERPELFSAMVNDWMKRI